jgi:acyl-coenzyme A thioesterase PaaI-like protein
MGWITNIPFVRKIGIHRNPAGNLELPFDGSVHNHIQTVHAGAQFALAETASGACLLSLFPELAAEVLPILKDAQVRYRSTTTRDITAYPSVADKDVQKFLKHYRRKGRGMMPIKVAVKDSADSLVCECLFNWFIQKRDQTG